MVLTAFGRLSLVERIARRLPAAAAGARARRDQRRAPRLRWPTGCASTSTASTACCTPSHSPLPTALGGNFLHTEWADVATAVQVSAYSLKSLTMAALPLMGRRRLGRGPGLRRQRGLAGLRLDGRGQGRAWSRPRATWPATSAREGIRVNLVAAGPIETMAAKSIPGFDRVRGRVGRPRPARLGHHRRRAGRARLRRAAVGLVPGHDRARSCTWTAACTRLAPDGRVRPHPVLPGSRRDRARGRGVPAPGRLQRAGQPAVRRPDRRGAEPVLHARAPGEPGPGPRGLPGPALRLRPGGGRVRHAVGAARHRRSAPGADHGVQGRSLPERPALPAGGRVTADRRAAGGRQPSRPGLARRGPWRGLRARAQCPW